MLSLEFCRQRQNKLLEYISLHNFGFAIFNSSRSIYYYSGVLVDAQWPQALVIAANGDSTLITGKEPSRCAASAVRTYTGYTVDRLFDRSTMQDELNRHVAECVGSRKTSLAVEFEFMPAGLLSAVSMPTMNVTPWLTESRRPKYPDEIESIKNTIALTEAAYGAIRRQLEPGMTEFQAYQIIYEAIVDTARTSVELKGDFGCGSRAAEGGPPTSNIVNDGDLCIFDLFPSYQGYMCDLCRTFCAGAPTAEQMELWTHVSEAHNIAHRLIRPGLSARALYTEIREHLEKLPHTRGSFTHHAGHGVGQEGWEHPWLNAAGDQVFVKGEVIACEPGLYSVQLGGGIRIEHNYLVTDEGPIALDNFPIEL